MWTVCLILSVACLVAMAVLPLAVNHSGTKKLRLFYCLFAGVFLAGLLLFFPIHLTAAETGVSGLGRAVLLCLYNAMQIFTIGTEFEVITGGIGACPAVIQPVFQVWAAFLFVLAPVFTFSFVLSFFQNFSARLAYRFSGNRKTYVFSELNERSFVLAADLKQNEPGAVIVFTGVQDGNEERLELPSKAKEISAVLFSGDLLSVNLQTRWKKKELFFFAIGSDETENLNQALELIEAYRDRENTRLYVFSNKLESELLLTKVDKGKLRVRRVNPEQSLIYRNLYENGGQFFENALPADDGIKDISAVIVGMGRHGTEMLKALTWFGQMDGYRIRLDAFDQDALAQERFTSLAPELMSYRYNGVYVEGEAQYRIRIHSGLAVDTAAFDRQISRLKRTTYVLVSLGDDDININTAVKLRMLFERIGIHPVIQAIIYSPRQKKALTGIRNFRGQAYDIEFIGDLESCYTEEVVLNSELEADALRRHLKWGQEEEFWLHEYNYRSSSASAIHMRARKLVGIPGAGKKEAELTTAERDTIEVLEHRRWNAYMRAEGYVFSGSKEKSSRNDLAKMHHDLVDFGSLSEEDKRKDSQVGTE